MCLRLFTVNLGFNDLVAAEGIYHINLVLNIIFQNMHQVATAVISKFKSI